MCVWCVMCRKVAEAVFSDAQEGGGVFFCFILIYFNFCFVLCARVCVDACRCVFIFI